MQTEHWYVRYSNTRKQIVMMAKVYRFGVAVGRLAALFVCGVALAVILGLGVLGVGVCRTLFGGVLVKSGEMVYTVSIDRGMVRIQEKQ